MADAFAKAGAATVVSTLWSVDDQSTAALMVEFYRGLQSAANPSREGNRADKAEALRQAQLKLLCSEEWSHPFYWGAVILMGEWR